MFAIMYDYEYGQMTCDLQKCFYCEEWIETKFCIVICEDDHYYFHKPCLFKFYKEV